MLCWSISQLMILFFQQYLPYTFQLSKVPRKYQDLFLKSTTIGTSFRNFWTLWLLVPVCSTCVFCERNLDVLYASCQCHVIYSISGGHSYLLSHDHRIVHWIVLKAHVTTSAEIGRLLIIFHLLFYENCEYTHTTHSPYVEH